MLIKIEDFDWASARTCLLFCICHAILLYEVWSAWDKLASAIRHICSFLSSITRRENVHVEMRLAELRAKKTHDFFRTSKSVVVCCILVFVYVSDPHDTLHVDSGLFALCGWYFGFVLVLAAPPTQRFIDFGFFLLSGVALCRLIWAGLSPGHNILMSAPLRIAWRSILSTVYMRWRISSLANFIQSVVVCCIYSLQSYDSLSCQSFVTLEFVAWSITTLQCIMAESWFKELLWKDFVATDAQRATQRLLSSFCDAVVGLAPDLRVIAVTPKLLHLLCPTMLLSPDCLEHALFSDLLATRSDQEKFLTFITSTVEADASEAVEGAAPALRVNLHYPGGNDVSVELFHAFSEGINRELQHFIGIREVRIDGQPDESQFKSKRGVVVPSIPTRSSQPQRSRSSKCSDASSSHRTLKGLSKVRFKIDPLDFCIQEYNLCLDNVELHPHQKPDLKSCLLGECSSRVIQWLQACMNSAVHDGIEPFVELETNVLFRPPTVACVSSKIVMCAKSIRFVTSGECDDDDDDLLAVVLEFRDVSQIVAGANKASSQSSFPQLTAVHEALE